MDVKERKNAEQGNTEGPDSSESQQVLTTPDVVAELGQLPPGAVVTEAAMARMFDRHPVSIKRAVARGELPAPTRLLGGNVWTAGAILRFLEARQEGAAKEREREARRFSVHRP